MPITRNITAAQWAAANPTLRSGELGIEKDTKKQKIGDGVTPWNKLSYQFTNVLANASYAPKAVVEALSGKVDRTQQAIDQAQLVDQAVGIARVASAFNRPAGGVSISRSGLDYWLWHGLGGGLYSRYQLQNQTGNVGGYALRQLSGLDTVRAMVDTDDTAANFVGAWVAGSNALSVGGAYKYSITAGDTSTWTSPAGSVSVGVTVVEITNGGSLMKVEVDGSSTAADRLDTAQDVVTRGWYANTILVANGGTLNPTDRVMDSYSPNTASNKYAARRVLAADLTPGAHIVKVTATNYNRIGLSSQRAYLTGFLHSFPTTKLSDAGVGIVTDTVLNAVASAWEYAYYGKPEGASVAGEMGNIHGNEIEISLTISVDGVASTPADGVRVDASQQITITRVSQMRHVELGTTAVADVVTTYRLGRRGLRVDVHTVWNRSIELTWAWLMLPVNGSTTNAAGQKFNRAALMDAASGPLTLTGLNGDSYHSRSRSVAGWVWSSTGKFGVMASVPDHTTFLNRWLNSGPAYAQVNDRSGNITKIYFARVSAAPVDRITAGTVIESSVRYLTGYFPNGAEASLATL